jgi:hypothetical protein
VRVEAGDAFGQYGADVIKRPAFFKAGRELFPSVTVPAGAFDEIAYFKIEFYFIGQYLIHGGADFLRPHQISCFHRHAGPRSGI